MKTWGCHGSRSLKFSHILSVLAEDKEIEGEAAYQLGLAYQRADDHNTAKQVPECVC